MLNRLHLMIFSEHPAKANDTSIVEINKRVVATLMMMVLTSILCTASGQSTASPIEEVLKDYKILSLNTNELYTVAEQSLHEPTIRLRLAGYDLVLYSANVLSQSYTALDSGGEAIPKIERAIPLRGHTREGLPVTVTISKTFLMASIGRGDDQIWIEAGEIFDKAFTKDQYVVYRSKNVINDPNATCGVTKVKREKDKYKDSNLRKSMSTCYDVEYAVAHDFSMTQELGSASNVESFGIAITNEMNSLYTGAFADDLNFQLTGQFISTSTAADPWTASTNANDLLPSFANWAPSNLAFPHDVATLWTNRNFDGTTIGLAYVGTVCTSARYNICEHQSTTTTNRRLVTHEVGHSFSLVHVSSNNIMAANAGNATDTWAASSVTAMENYYNGLPNGCLDSPCQLGDPSISWLESSSTISETSYQNNSGGSCAVAFQDYSVTLDRSNFSASDITVDITVAPSSTATTSDYQLMTNSVTFTSGGALMQDVIVRVFDDAIEEGQETINLQFTITSGAATSGSITTHMIQIEDTEDDVTTICCSDGGIATYNPGPSFTSYLGFLAGNNPQFRSRYLITAAELGAIGMTAGPISQLELDVSNKSSSGSFNDFRIGLANVAGTALPSDWISTTEVFFGSHTTTTGWNAFPFSMPFFWDGTSSLYIELCFVNPQPVGADALLCNTVASTRASYVSQYSGSNICSGGVVGQVFNNFIPVTRFSTLDGARIATQVTSTHSSPIASGETVHLYSAGADAIASLTNTGSTDISCIDISIHSAGTGTAMIPGSASSYCDKTFEINTDNDAAYQLSLYYKDSELATWGGTVNNLSIVKSPVPLSSATASDVEVASTSTSPFAGLDNGTTFTAVFAGDGYFSITDKAADSPSVMDGSLYMEEVGRGILMTSASGTRYLVYEASPNNLTVTPAPSVLSGASLDQSDIDLTSIGSLYLRPAAGSGYSQYTIDNNGELLYTAATAPSPPMVRLVSGHFEIIDAGRGLLMSSPDGTCYKVAVADTDGGSLDISVVPCP